VSCDLLLTFEIKPKFKRKALSNQKKSYQIISNQGHQRSIFYC